MSGEIPGVFHVSSVEKSDLTATPGELGGVKLSFRGRKVAYHFQAPTL